MARRFNAEEAIITEGTDRKKLRVGRYLVKLVDAREVRGAYKGDRFQLDFEVVKGKFAAPGTKKGDIVMLKSLEAANGKEEKDRIKKDNGKIKVMLGAFLGMKGEAVTQKIYEAACREQLVESDSKQTKILSESCKAEEVTGFGKLAVLIVEPHVLKTGKNAGKKSCYYRYEPFKGNDSIFEEYDPSTEDYSYEDEGDDDNKYEQANEDLAARRRQQTGADEAPSTPDEDPPPPDEDEPLTKAAKDGWKFNTKSKPGAKYYFRTGKDGKTEQLKEADLVAKYS